MRFTKISARELLFKRDQTTGDALEIKDSAVSDLQYQRRRKEITITLVKSRIQELKQLRSRNVIW